MKRIIVLTLFLTTLTACNKSINSDGYEAQERIARKNIEIINAKIDDHTSIDDFALLVMQTIYGGDTVFDVNDFETISEDFPDYLKRIFSYSLISFSAYNSPSQSQYSSFLSNKYNTTIHYFRRNNANSYFMISSENERIDFNSISLCTIIPKSSNCNLLKVIDFGSEEQGLLAQEYVANNESTNGSDISYVTTAPPLPFYNCEVDDISIKWSNHSARYGFIFIPEDRCALTSIFNIMIEELNVPE